MASAKTKKDEFKFEENLARLDQIALRLEDGSLSLEESIKFFEEGMILYNNCVEVLDKARNRVELLLKRGEQLTTQPAPTDDDTLEDEDE